MFVPKIGKIILTNYTRKLTNKIVKNFLSFILPKDMIIWHGNRKVGNSIAITFDDGPNPIYTEKIIDILQIYDIKATFFLLGCEVERNPDIVRRLINYGHSIGNHTYSHKYKPKTIKSELEIEIQKTQKIIKETINIIPTIFRPPHGYININEIKYCRKNNLSTILWSVDSMDYKKASVELILNNVNPHTIKSGDIILFHDDNEYSIEALPIIIENLIEKYGFLTIEQMIQACRKSL